MTLLKKDQLANNIASLIHRDTQQQNSRMDLTADEIHRFTQPGSLDFGGSEFEPADRQLISPKKKDKDDDYGWWNLPGGNYQITMNEKVSSNDSTNMLGILVPHEHARQAGIIAESRILLIEEEQQLLTLNICVLEAGCNIKENARVAALYIIEEH